MTSWQHVRPAFEGTGIAHVATLLPDGSPHSVPVWAGVEGEHVAFFTIAGSRKDRNVQADPRVALSVTAPDQPLAMAFVRGNVVRRLEGDDAMAVVDRLSLKYEGKPYGERSGFVAFLVEPTRSWANDFSED